MSTAHARATSKSEDTWSLTPREREVLLAVGRRLSNPEIAEAFTLSKRTVECYISSLYVKTGAVDRRGLRHAAAQVPAASPPLPLARAARRLHAVPGPAAERRVRPEDLITDVAHRSAAKDPEFWQHFIDMVGHRVSHNRLTVESTRRRSAEQQRRRQQRHASRADVTATVG